MFRKYGNQEISVEGVHALFGPGESVIFRREFPDRWEAVLKDYLECYRQEHETLRVDGWILELLEDLKKQDVPMGIVTNKERDTTRLTLDHFGLAKFFSVVITAQDVQRPKPYPEGILKALRILGASFDEAIFLGDTRNDREAAAGSGVGFVQALWYVPPSMWPQEPDWTVAPSPDDLHALLAAHLAH